MIEVTRLYDGPRKALQLIKLHVNWQLYKNGSSREQPLEPLRLLVLLAISNLQLTSGCHGEAHSMSHE